MKCVICEGEASVKINETNESDDPTLVISFYLCRKCYVSATIDDTYDTYEGWRDFKLGIE